MLVSSNLDERYEAIHAGLSNISLSDDLFELGQGITVSKTYAHLMSPYVMAFNPAPRGKHHPGPWKPALGGVAIDIEAELFVPLTAANSHSERIDIATTILFLLRLGVDPAASLPIISNRSFKTLRDMPELQALLIPYEVKHRYFALVMPNAELTASTAEWVRDHWPTVIELRRKTPAFSLAADAIDSGQFLPNYALTLVSLWGALEAIFTTRGAEIGFRLSHYVASYLEPQGEERKALQKRVKKLYDARSGAAHGTPAHTRDDLLDSFNLMRRVLIKIIEAKHLPTQDELSALLLCGPVAAPSHAGDDAAKPS